MGFVTVTNSLYSNNADFKVRARDDGSQNFIQMVDTRAFDVITTEFTVLEVDGVQTNKSLIAATGAQRITVFRCSISIKDTNSAKQAIRIGFGATTLAAAALTGVTGIIISHGGLYPGSGLIEDNAVALGRGAAGESVLMTSSTPTGGDFRVVISYILEAS